MCLTSHSILLIYWRDEIWCAAGTMCQLSVAFDALHELGSPHSTKQYLSTSWLAPSAVNWGCAAEGLAWELAGSCDSSNPGKD